MKTLCSYSPMLFLLQFIDRLIFRTVTKSHRIPSDTASFGIKSFEQKVLFDVLPHPAYCPMEQYAGEF